VRLVPIPDEEDGETLSAIDEGIRDALKDLAGAIPFTSRTATRVQPTSYSVIAPRYAPVAPLVECHWNGSGLLWDDARAAGSLRSIAAGRLRRKLRPR